MAVYATADDVAERTTRTFSSDELSVVEALLQDAAVMIDSYNVDAPSDAKLVVSCRMVLRAMGDGMDYGPPMGATQGSMAAGGYSQSWTISSGGAAGELYIGKAEKKLLGVGDKVGAHSPLEEMVPND